MFVFVQGGTIEFEAFAVGKWNGMTFTRPDLEQIAANFAALDALHKVPLKFGHNDQQKLTDGFPALGWVTKAWVDDRDKLMLRAEHVPEIVQNAIKKKLYRKVSVELDLDVEHRGKKYAYVLTAVALLGADIPAVNTLKDLDHYIGGESRLAASRRAEFSAIDGLVTFKQKEDEMSVTKEEMQKMIGEAVAPLNDAIKKQGEEIKAKDAQIAKFTKDEEDRKAADKQTKVKLAREGVKKVLEDAVKADVITPGQREMFSKTLGIDDDEKVLALDIEELKKLVDPNGKAAAMFSKDEGRQKPSGTPERKHEDAGDEITHRANELRVKEPKLSFVAARDRVVAADPELAREYLTGEKVA